MKIIIRGGHIVNAPSNMKGVGDIVLENNKITGIRIRNLGERASDADLKGAQVMDASGMHVMPGLIDLHAHLREPGFEHKENIKSGTAAAVHGGFTAVCCMPNTKPVNDSPAITSYILDKAKGEGSCRVLPIGAVTKGQRGDELVDFEALCLAGCVAFSDDGMPVTNTLIMRKALEYSRTSGRPVIAHCEDTFLAKDGVMNEGKVSAALGLKGIPAAAEEIMVARDLILAGLTKGRLHIAHVSTKGSVELIRRAKNDGLNVTAETCPHYFSITDQAVGNYRAAAKVNPPLRTSKDVEAIKEGLRDGTIDVIATDHAPHHKDEKMLGMEKAPFGISGLETALGLSMALVHDGLLTVSQIYEKMVFSPSRILGLDTGYFKVGSEGDILIMDADREWRVKPEEFRSMGKNTPFSGRSLKGMPVFVISGGILFDFMEGRTL